MPVQCVYIVPSLYVRVYRAARYGRRGWLGSLTIREGISSLLFRFIKIPLFPHYTWGYIAVQPWKQFFTDVPSLYVRVYQQHLKPQNKPFMVPSLYVRVYHTLTEYISKSRCSLTIREGISALSDSKEDDHRFPHYTWGYIDRANRFDDLQAVPSLYVRVYRLHLPTGENEARSLTIREGISLKVGALFMRQGFPHYTWGYIGTLKQFYADLKVPSLYVRVYRKCSARWSGKPCSLTIREGISRIFVVKSGVCCVPSLYVRVYRWVQFNCIKSKSSLTIREGISP